MGQGKVFGSTTGWEYMAKNAEDIISVCLCVLEATLQSPVSYLKWLWLLVPCVS